MRDDFLGRRLASGSSNAHQRLTPQPTNGRSKLLQRDQRVVDSEQRCLLWKPRQLVTAHHCRNRASGKRGFHKIMAIEAIALHGKEQVPRLNSPRIDGVAASDGTRIELPARLHELGGAREVQLHDLTGCAAAYPACCNAFWATSTSSKETRPSLVS